MQTRGPHRLRPRECVCSIRSIPEPEFLNDSAIAVDVTPLHVLQQTPPPADHLQQATTAMMILLVDAEVIVEVVDPLRENRDLYATGAGIVFRCAVLLNRWGLVESHDDA